MRAPRNLHILAISSGLTDEQVVEIWAQASEQAGNRNDPRFDRKAHKVMMQLIEAKATEDVPFNLVPWVLFDLHVGLLIVRTRLTIESVSAQIRHFATELRGKHTA